MEELPTPEEARPPSPHEEGVARRHWAWLKARCLRLLARADSAEDATRQALARLVREGPRGDETDRLLVLSGDLCEERLRGGGRSSAEWRRNLAAGAPTATLDPRSLVLSQLAYLDRLDRLLVLDRWLDGLPPETLARARGLTLARVEKRLGRFKARAEERLQASEGTGLPPPADPPAAPAVPSDDELRAAAAGLARTLDALPPPSAHPGPRRLLDPGVWGPAVALAATAGLILFMLWPSPRPRVKLEPLGPLTFEVGLTTLEKNGSFAPLARDRPPPAGQPVGLRLRASEDRLASVVRIGSRGPAELAVGLEHWPVLAGDAVDIPPLLSIAAERQQERLVIFFCSLPMEVDAMLRLVEEAYPAGLDSRRDLGGDRLRDLGDCQVRSLLLRWQ